MSRLESKNRPPFISPSKRFLFLICERAVTGGKCIGWINWEGRRWGGYDTPVRSTLPVGTHRHLVSILNHYGDMC